MQIHDFFQVTVSPNKMEAYLDQIDNISANQALEEQDIIDLLHEKKVTFGIDLEKIKKIISAPHLFTYPVTIARGKKPINGKNASIEYAKPFKNVDDDKNDQKQFVDLKKVLVIPSAKEGELLARKIEATTGEDGMNVFGQVVRAKPGKDVRLRPGKNTRIDEQKQEVYSEIDGKLSVIKNVISVFPIYEVNGDLNLQTGNITFIGNVHIHGSVPSGYQIVANGDIVIDGIAEASYLQSGGSIFIHGGILGQQKGLIKAKGNVHTNYINQGIVEADGDIVVTHYILHSQCTAKGSIFCDQGKGEVVGGILSSQTMISANIIGNEMNTRTKLFLGINEETVKREKEIRKQIITLEQNIKKISLIEEKLTKLGQLDPKQRVMLLRIKNTKVTNEQEFDLLSEEYEDIKAIFVHWKDAELIVKDSVFPNVEVHFGKLSRELNQVYKYCKITIVDEEISIVPLF